MKKKEMPLILPFVSKSQDSVSTFNKKDSIISKNEQDEKYRETYKEDWEQFPLDSFEYYYLIAYHQTSYSNAILMKIR